MEKAEALDDHTVKFFFKEKPGLAIWEAGVSQARILAKHFWEPVVEEAKQAEGLRAQRTALFGHVPVDEPTAGPMLFSRRVPGGSIELRKNPNYYWRGSTVKEYANGAYIEEKPGVFKYQDFGDPQGEPVVALTRGPHVDGVTYTIFVGEKTNRTPS